MSDSRAEFEAWVETLGGHPFAGQFLNLMWNAWQASRAQPERRLTDAEILKLVADFGIECDGNFHRTDDEDRANMVDFARAILAAQPAAATVPEKSATSNHVEIQRKGTCFWHTNCRNHFGGVMMEVVHTKNSTLLECLHCGKRAHYPVGGVGRICAEAVQPPAAQPQDDGEKR